MKKTPAARDIPHVTLTDVQLVEAAEFELCFSQVGPLYEQLQYLKDGEGVARSSRGSKSDSPVKSYEDSRKSGGHHYDPPQLSTIPDIYFDEDFHLQNPRTFDVVSERSDVVIPLTSMTGKVIHENTSAPRKALATNGIL